MKTEILYAILAITFVIVLKVGSRDPNKAGPLRVLAVLGFVGNADLDSGTTGSRSIRMDWPQYPEERTHLR